MHYSLMILIPKRVFKQYNLVIDDIINNAQIESLYLRRAMEPYEEQPSNPKYGIFKDITEYIIDNFYLNKEALCLRQEDGRIKAVSSKDCLNSAQNKKVYLPYYKFNSFIESARSSHFHILNDDEIMDISVEKKFRTCTIIKIIDNEIASKIWADESAAEIKQQLLSTVKIYGWSNPNAKWDYYTINAFSIKKNDSDCDDSDIDDNSFEELVEDSDSVLCDYDDYDEANANVVDDFENDLGADLDNDHSTDDDQEKVEELKKLFKIYEQYEYIPAILSVKEFLENQYILKNWDDQKEAAYRRLWQLASGEDDPTEEEKSHDYYQFERNTEYYKSTYGNVENYIEFKKKYRTKAILTEQHGWVEESGDRIEKEYGDKFDSIIKSADPEDAVVLIDCHI